MTAARAEIRIGVELDDQRLAERIVWQATEGGMPGPRAAAAFILSVWDPEDRDTLGIDLWTKSFPVDDMRQLMGQTLVRLGDVFARATKDEALSRRIVELGHDVMTSGGGDRPAGDSGE
jgi:gliding motility-associated protein GldC